MICHVCEQEAVGQCKGCGKFYCRAHGDVYCVRCDTAVKPEGTSLDREVEFGVRPLPAPASGPRCHACNAPADRACCKCGVFFCDQHGGVQMSRRSWGEPMCNDCAGTETGWLMFTWIIGGIVLVIGAIIMCAGFSHMH